MMKGMEILGLLNYNKMKYSISMKIGRKDDSMKYICKKIKVQAALDKCNEYIKFIMIPILTCILLCLCADKIQAAETQGIKLENEQSIKKYDVTGDGKKDTIKIYCSDKDKYFDGFGYERKVKRSM